MGRVGYHDGSNATAVVTVTGRIDNRTSRNSGADARRPGRPTASRRQAGGSNAGPRTRAFSIVRLRTRAFSTVRPHTRAFSIALALLLFAALGVGGVTAQTVFLNPDFEYIVDIPVGWEVLDGQNTAFISFTDPDHVAVFQILAFPGNQFVTADEIERYVRESYGATGDKAPFRYHGQPAVFADYRFTAGSYDVRGYMTFINRDEFDFAVMTFVPEDYYEQYHDYILSALDSFSPDTVTRNYPGPVSQFFGGDLPATAHSDAAANAPAAPSTDRPAAPPAGASSDRPAAPPATPPAGASSDRPADAAATAPTTATAASQGSTITLPEGTAFELPPSVAADSVVDAAQTLIEREARVLSSYAPSEAESPRIGNGPAPPWAVAWRRYFRMIYRDSYTRLQPVAEAIFQDLARAGVPRNEMPARILEWLQTAQYQRTRSLSDLMSPSACLVQFAGDCDSLGITYAIILQHLGFDAILMASIEYAHAMVGVDVPGEGARFPFSGREWLVAELTKEVGIGQIAQDMSDIGGWIGVKLDPTIQW